MVLSFSACKQCYGGGIKLDSFSLVASHLTPKAEYVHDILKQITKIAHNLIQPTVKFSSAHTFQVCISPMSRDEYCQLHRHDAAHVLRI